MARAARSEGSADRVAARRRDAWKTKERPTPRGGSPRPTKGARGAKAPGLVPRLMKLGVLIAAFALIGFFAVLVIDGAASLISQVKIGSVGTTVAELVDKIADRVLDRDVPRAAPQPTPKKAERRTHEAVRAPVPAARPEDDARHVDPPRRDPQVEAARERLDELLRRL